MTPDLSNKPKLLPLRSLKKIIPKKRCIVFIL